MSFEIQLPLFKGPFDLLLFFIERDELDINDIPIAKITKSFFEYLTHLEHLNVEVASEFILVASSLMRIKAKMLVPRPELDEEGETVDPRKELVQKLIEYKRYKSVIGELEDLETLRLSKEARGNVVAEIKKLAEVNDVEAEVQNLDLYKILKVYRRALERHEIEKSKPTHEVVQYAFTITGQKQYILDKVEQGEVSFVDMIKDKPEKIAVIFNFLSILELLNLKLIKMRIGLGYNNFWIEKYSDQDET